MTPEASAAGAGECSLTGADPPPVPLVQSPEKLQARLEEIQGAVERERQATAEGERRARDLQARLDAVAKVGVCCLLVGWGAISRLPASVEGSWAEAKAGMCCWLARAWGGGSPSTGNVPHGVRAGGMHLQVEAGGCCPRGVHLSDRTAVGELLGQAAGFFAQELCFLPESPESLSQGHLHVAARSAVAFSPVLPYQMNIRKVEKYLEIAVLQKLMHTSGVLHLTGG